MSDKKHGGKREGAGRKPLPDSKKEKSVMVRVPEKYLKTVKLVVETLKKYPSAELEEDAKEKINQLEKQLENLKDNGEAPQLRKQLNQLQSELYPALKKLIELDQKGSW